ncbi:MAG: hypothetical protein QXL06_04765 [Nitrososphaerota archaeon]
MVKIVKLEHKEETGTYYMCEECDLIYAEISIAKCCEDWCRNHKSCNLEITRNAIKFEG